VRANLEALQQLKALQAAPIRERAGRRLWLHFDSRPVRIIGRERVTGLEVTGRMSGVLHAGLVVRAIGHQSIPVGTVPFDRATGRIVHDGARVPANATTGTPVYVAGWARRGATGVVATNRACASIAVARLLDDVAKRTSRPAKRHADELLEQRGIKPVSYGGWTAIDAEERSRGRQAGKQRVKVGTWSELQAVSTSCSAPEVAP
jgi:ferredoxin/flavodoxin---NADP+ reductase